MALLPVLAALLLASQATSNKPNIGTYGINGEERHLDYFNLSRDAHRASCKHRLGPLGRSPHCPLRAPACHKPLLIKVLGANRLGLRLHDKGYP